MSRYYGWAPYVSVAEQRQQAQKKIDKLKKKGQAISPVVIKSRKIVKTFWGKAWCDHLEEYSDYANRLPRGKRYVRNGSVVDLQIGPGVVTALVSGSSLYKVEVKIKALEEPRWQAITQACRGQVRSLLSLLQGDLSDDIMETLCDPKNGVLPRSRDISLSCSCPDWAVMCKHVAAVLYGVGARLDSTPELLFTLRQVDSTELLIIDGAALYLDDEEAQLGDDDLSSLFGIDLVDDDAPDFAATSAAPDALIRSRDLTAQGIPSSKVQGWLRSGVLERTSRRGEYRKTARSDAMITEYLSANAPQPTASRPKKKHTPTRPPASAIKTCHAVGLEAVLDRYLPSKLGISHAQVIQALILCLLVGVEDALHISGKSINKTINQRENLQAGAPKKLTNRAIINALAALGEVAMTDLYAELAVEAMEHRGAVPSSLHLDHLTFTARGSSRTSTYTFEAAGEGDPVALGLCLARGNEVRLPVGLEVVLDTPELISAIEAGLEAFLKDSRPYLVLDSGLYEEDALESLDADTVAWITRVPEHLDAAQALLKDSSGGVFEALGANKGIAAAEFEYGDHQRWVFFYEEAQTPSSGFILTTNILDEEACSPEELLALHNKIPREDQRGLEFLKRRPLIVDKKMLDFPSWEAPLATLLSIAELIYASKK